jgi:hypothetical protein
MLTSQLYGTYTSPALCNHWHKHRPLPQRKYIQTHTRATKPRRPHTPSPTHPILPFLSPLLARPLLITHFYP